MWVGCMYVIQCIHIITPFFSYHVLEVRLFVFDLFSMSHQTCNLPQRKQDIFLMRNIFNERIFDVKKHSGGIIRSCFLNYNSSRWDVMPSRIMRLGSWLPWWWVVESALLNSSSPKHPKTKHRPKRKNTHVFQHLPAIGSSSNIFQPVSCQELLSLVVMAWFKSMQWISNGIYSMQWRSFRTFREHTTQGVCRIPTRLDATRMASYDFRHSLGEHEFLWLC